LVGIKRWGIFSQKVNNLYGYKNKTNFKKGIAIRAKITIIISVKDNTTHNESEVNK
jgi:hypothetical protein